MEPHKSNPIHTIAFAENPDVAVEVHETEFGHRFIGEVLVDGQRAWSSLRLTSESAREDAHEEALRLIAQRMKVPQSNVSSSPEGEDGTIESERLSSVAGAEFFRYTGFLDGKAVWSGDTAGTYLLDVIATHGRAVEAIEQARAERDANQLELDWERALEDFEAEITVVEKSASHSSLDDQTDHHLIEGHIEGWTVHSERVSLIENCYADITGINEASLRAKVAIVEKAREVWARQGKPVQKLAEGGITRPTGEELIETAEHMREEWQLRNAPGSIPAPGVGPLVAAGGWSVPIDQAYFPDVTATRGGVQFTRGPDLEAILDPEDWVISERAAKRIAKRDMRDRLRREKKAARRRRRLARLGAIDMAEHEEELEDQRQETRRCAGIFVDESGAHADTRAELDSALLAYRLSSDSADQLRRKLVGERQLRTQDGTRHSRELENIVEKWDFAHDRAESLQKQLAEVRSARDADATTIGKALGELERAEDVSAGLIGRIDELLLTIDKLCMGASLSPEARADLSRPVFTPPQVAHEIQREVSTLLSKHIVDTSDHDEGARIVARLVLQAVENITNLENRSQ